MLKLVGHKGDVRAVAFAPDGRVVSGGSDKTVRVWNPVSGECLETIKTRQVVYAVTVSPDGDTIAYGGRPEPSALVTKASVCDFIGTPFGRYGAHTRGRVYRHDPVAGLVFEEVAVPRTIWSLSFSADGQYLAAAVRKPGGGNVPDGAGGYFWRIGAMGEPNQLPGEDIYALAFAPTGHGIAVTRKSSVVFLPSVIPGEAVVAPGPPTLFENPSSAPAPGITYRFSASWAPAVAFVPGSDLAAVASNSFIEFVNPARAAKQTRVKTGSRTILALAATPDGKTLYAGGKPGAVEVYDTATRAKRTEYDFEIGGVYALACSPDGLTFAAAGDKGLVLCDADQ